jgi:ribonucleoside-diphosphate reductase alpha chain
MGHIKMMAATQPFLSGAISKTVNLPHECSVEDIEEAYLEAWKLGLKAIAVYRDGCKRSQPLSTRRVEDTSGKGFAPPSANLPPEEYLRQVAATIRPKGPPVAIRRKLPDERASVTHKFSIAGHDGYITVGMYEDGSAGELFIRMAKEGSTISGLMDSFALAVSLALQHGVPLQLLCDKFEHTRFDPAGFTTNPEIQRASSIMDYIFRWLRVKFHGAAQAAAPEQLALTIPPELPKPVVEAPGTPSLKLPVEKAPAFAMPWAQETDAPTCHECGSIMVRSGACHKCMNCGATSGCS